LREGRKIQLCAVRLRADGVVVVGATVLKIKVQANELPPEADRAGRTAGAGSIARRARGFFLQPVRDRHVAARRARPFGVPGPGAIWYRVDRPIVEGAPVSQAMRAMVAADFCNGTSAVLDFRQWTFLNADLTVNFARQPVGDWILLDAESWIGPDGAGSRWRGSPMSSGYFGRAVQSLVIEKR
jgi:hypothetical protein